jgi:hypothetical protein
MSLGIVLAASLLPLPLTPPGRDNSWTVSGDLHVAQFATLDMDRLDREWGQPDKVAQLSTDSETVRNKPIFTFLAMYGCHPDTSGNCNVTAAFDVFDPDGKLYGHQRDTEAWKRPPIEGNIVIMASFLGLRVEPGEKLGNYLVRVTTTDHVTGSVVHTEEKLMVTEAK